jgi:hypothetical protein
LNRPPLECRDDAPRTVGTSAVRALLPLPEEFARMDGDAAAPSSVHDLTLEEEASHLLEEARMVLPGIQALFGFQLVAVFSNGFREHLSHRQQLVHLAATALSCIAAACVLAPAAYHRQAHPGRVTRGFLRLSSALLTVSMVPLALGISLDLYLVARAVEAPVIVAFALAGGVAALFAGLWFALPRARRAHRA